MISSNYLYKFNLKWIKDLGYVSLSRVVVVTGQLVFIKLYSARLTSYELGIYFFLTTVSYSLNAFFFVPIDFYQQAKIYSSRKNQISLSSYAIFNKKLILTIIGLTLITTTPFLFLKKDIAVYGLICAAMSIIFYLNTALRGVINNLEYRTTASNNLVIEAVLKILFFYFAIQLLPATALTLLVSGVTASFLCFVLLIDKCRALNVFRGGSLQEVTAKEVFAFSYPISIGAIFNWVQLQGYRLVLVPLGYAELVGIFSTVANVGTAGMNAYATIFGQLFIPNLYKSLGSYAGTYLRNAFISVLTIAFLGYIFSDLLVALVTKQEFVAYSKIIMYGVAAEAGNFIIGAFGIFLSIKNKTNLLLKSSALGLLTMIIFFIIFYVITGISTITIGLSISLSQVATVLYLFFIFKKNYIRMESIPTTQA